MKLIIHFALATLLLGSLAHGETYTCHGGPNSNRGFNYDFDVQVDPVAKGGKIIVHANDKNKSAGIIALVTIITPNEPVFAKTLGQIGEPDVSGVPAAELKNVTSIALYGGDSPDGDAVSILRLFNDSTQIGGTFMAYGMGTACLPK